jgi:hypothetical protein
VGGSVLALGRLIQRDVLIPQPRVAPASPLAQRYCQHMRIVITHPANVWVVLLLTCTAGVGGFLPARSGSGRGLVPHCEKNERGSSNSRVM